MSTSLLWNLWMSELPGVLGDGMSGRNDQRKTGTARGSPRRSRTAKALRISRRAAKSQCAGERGGWGRLSDDGSGQHNPIRSEGPWGGWISPPDGGAVYRVDRSDFERISAEARKAMTNRTLGQCMPGAGLSCPTPREGLAGYASLGAVPGKTRRAES